MHLLFLIKTNGAVYRRKKPKLNNQSGSIKAKLFTWQLAPFTRVLLKAGPRPTAQFTARGPAARGPLHGLWPSGPRPTQRPLAQRPVAHSTDQRPNFFGQRLIEVHAQLRITVGFSTCKMDDGEFPFSFRFLFKSIQFFAILLIVCFILLRGKRLSLCTCFNRT